MPAAPHDLAPDVAARHRDRLDRQRKLAEDRHALRGVADADEFRRHRGDDLLARELAADAATAPSMRPLIAASASMKKFTVEPEPTPTTRSSTTCFSAAFATRCF